MKLSARFFPAFLALCLSSCGSSPDPRLAPLSRATLEPGGGLGDVRLGETTLGAFVDRFGCGRTSLVVSDASGIELEFEDGQLAFLFLYQELVRDQAEQDAILKLPRDLPGYLAAFPKRRELPLSSVSIAAGNSPRASFFQGNLAPGVALFDPLPHAAARIGIPEEGRPPMVAGLSPSLPDDVICYPERGLVLYGERRTESDVFSAVTRMTIFPPQ